MKKNLINFSILTLSVGIPLFFADLIMKSLYLPKEQARVYLLSEDGFISDNENNIIKFRYSSIRSFRFINFYYDFIDE